MQRTLARVLSAATVTVFPGLLSAQAARDPMQEGLHLKPARTLTFSTSVGSWMSLDVSPDGQSIVFDLLGDLYTMPVTGGKAISFTRGMAFDGQPRYSPDGKKVVFVSDRDGGLNIWTISVDKRDTVQITKGKTNAYESPVWTPDGRYIIATKNLKLWMFDVEGGQGLQLIRGETPPGGGSFAIGNELRQTGPAFGGSSRYVWYSQRRGIWEYNTVLGDYTLMVYDRESGETNARETRWGSALRPTLSRDGRWLVYATRRIDQTWLRIRDLTTGDERWLAGPVQRDDQESRATMDTYPGMSFTPDSKHLVATWAGKLWKVPVDGGSPSPIPFEVDVVQAMAPAVRFEYAVTDSATFVVKQIRDAVPSPDGKRLAFIAMDRLYVMDHPNGEPRRLTNVEVGEYQPAWSADGQWLAYTTWSTKDAGHLYKVRSQPGSAPVRLTTMAGFWQQPVFSPSGSRIVAIRGSARSGREGGGSAQDLVWVPSNGGDATVIAPAGGFSRPHFTRDSTRIYGSGGARGLASMRWDGTDVRSHLRVSGGGGGILISPNGDQALAQSGIHLYVMAIPQVGGEAPTINVASPDAAAFPVRKLTDIGAQFPAWGTDGRTVHWSIGNAHVVYDLAAAKAFDDSVRRSGPAQRAGADSVAGRSAPAKYRPVETRVRVVAQRDVPTGGVVLRGARVISMKGQQVIENADLVVTNNRITAVGRRGSVTIPGGARVIDVSGKTIVPGFVDTHAHVRPPSNLHREESWSYAANLAYGVTLIRDPQTGSTDVLSYEDQVRAGRMLGPRVYSTGPGFGSSENVRSLEDARYGLRRYAEYYDTKTLKQYEAGNREARQWIIQAANEVGIMPTTEGSLDIRMTITEAIDGYSGHEHAITTYPLQSDLIRLIAESGMAYTPTILVAYGAPFAENYWFSREDVLGDQKLRRFTAWSELEGKILRRSHATFFGWFHESQYTMKLVGETVRDLVAAGGRAGVGSHGELQGLGYHWELWSMAQGGLSNHDALRVATLMGADAIGLGKDLGSLEVGKLADLIVLDRNPLENLRNTNTIRFVMKNGRLYDASTLDEMWPRQRKAGPFEWQDEERVPASGPGVRWTSKSSE